MKIGLATPYDLSVPGGVNAHVFSLAAELRDRGFEVKILGPASDPRRVTDPEVITIGSAVPLYVAGSVARLDVNPCTIPRLVRVLRRERFDLLHLHEPFVPMVPFACLLFSSALKVATFHLYREQTHRLYQWSAPWLRLLARRLDVRIAVSPAARRTVSEFLPDDYAVIPNGVACERFAGPRTEPASPTILFLGRLERRKGLPDLLRAFRLVRRNVPGVRLLVAGSGSGRSHAEAWFARER